MVKYNGFTVMFMQDISIGTFTCHKTIVSSTLPSQTLSVIHRCTMVNILYFNISRFKSCFYVNYNINYMCFVLAVN